jgi:5-methylcytosine-specific restriction endonuclease McrA
MRSEPTLRDNCGTRSGYQLHGYYKEKACDPCREANTARFRRWAAANREKERERNKKNRAEPIYREKKQVAHRQRRASLNQVESDDYTYQDVLHIYGIECHICKETIDLTAPRRVGEEGWERGLHLDHVVSIKHGGTDTLDNVKPAHALCNIRKGAGDSSATV